MSQASTARKTGKVAQVAKANGALEFGEKELGKVPNRSVRVRVQACGVCHSDSFAFHGGFPGLQHPIVPGHEIIGIVEEVGEETGRLKPGDRVGIGWHGGHCYQCESCRRGDFITCEKGQIPGVTIDGGYAEFATFPEDVCAKVPEAISSSEAAPLMCAGVTTFNSLRHAGAMPGDNVAVLGLGGLGHLGVQFANKMGFNTIAIARGSDKAAFAKELGAHHYIDSTKDGAVETLKKMGGAKVILSTITDSDAMSPWVDALSVGGRLLIVGADFKPMQISPVLLIGARRSITGWPSGTARDSEDCMNFCALTNIRPMIESFPFEKAPEAYDRMMSGKARFRVVIENKK